MAEKDPVLLLGGMGVGVSTWRLAQAVALEGQRLNRNVVGTVSLVGLPPIMASRIRRGDPGTIRVISEFNPDAAQSLIKEYASGPLKIPAKPEVLARESGVSEAIRKRTMMMAVMAAYAEVAQARLAPDGQILEGQTAANLLEKTQLANAPAILGAMAAGVDRICVGAGYPNQIEGILNNFANGDPATYRVDVAGSTEKIEVTVNPWDFMPKGTKLRKPKFGVIAGQHAIPMRLKNADLFIIESPEAGGHNSPTREGKVLEDGQPEYTSKDQADLTKMIGLKKPFYLAGGRNSPEKLAEAQGLGATGIQAGSIFALSRESGLQTSIKLELLRQIQDGTLTVVTSLTASPSGFPFQVVQLDGTLSEPEVFLSRKRICNFGHLVEAYKKDDGSGIGFRCPAEPIEDYERKGGDRNRAVNAVCLCNALGSAAGYGLPTERGIEPMIVTLGKDTSFFEHMELEADGMYSAAVAVRYLLRSSN